MPRRIGALLVFTNPRKFSGLNKNPSFAEQQRVQTFSTNSFTTDNFENIMSTTTDFFNDAINGGNIDDLDFSELIALINGLDVRYDDIKNFLLDTLTIANSSKLYKNQAFNLAEQLEILQNEYEELLGKYNWLKEHCGEVEDHEHADVTLTFATKVEVSMELVYTLYQHFFGYPSDGIWDEEKANMIRRHLQDQQVTNLREDGSLIKTRYTEAPIKIKLLPGPAVNLEVAAVYATEWTVGFSSTSITANAGDSVTQNTGGTVGVLKNSLSGSVTSAIITSAIGQTFDTVSPLTINSIVVAQSDLVSATPVTTTTSSTSVGDTILYTNIELIHSKTEFYFGIQIGQQIIIGFNGPNPETRIIIGFGSIIINKPLKYIHPPGALIVVIGNDGRYNFLSGTIIKVNGKFESYDILLDDGGIIYGVKENLIEDGKIVDTRSDCNTFNNNDTEYICLKCGSDSCSCKCETCGDDTNTCGCK